jgi:D-arabinose 1-dehydrogenase-like Zn-dependent alcohol dehydrogenase
MRSYDVIAWGKPLEERDYETPKPSGTEVLLRVKYCGVCHSDVHIRDGYFDLGGGRRLTMSERGMSLPATLGHEPYGTIIAAGSEADDAAIGAARLVYPWTGCGACANCAEGADNYCAAPRYIGIHRPGSYADHLLVPHSRYLIDVGGIDPAWAATLSCSGLSAFAAVAKLRPIPAREWVVVIGTGGLGLSSIAILRALGHGRIVAVDIDDRKLAVAREAGALAIFNGSDERTPKRLRQLTEGQVYGAIDLVGSSATVSFAIATLRKGGRLSLVGLYGGEVSLSLVATIQRALTIQGSHLGTLAELKEVVALAREGKLKPIPIRKRPVSEVSQILDELKSGAIVGRVVVEI